MPRRLLLGSHDIEAFTTEMARWPTVRDLVAALADRRGNAGAVHWKGR
jgi:hypothetical protein